MSDLNDYLTSHTTKHFSPRIRRARPSSPSSVVATDACLSRASK